MTNLRRAILALVLTLTALALGTFAAAAGQSHSRITGMTEIHKGRFYWQNELAQAQLAHAPPQKIAELQKIVADHNARGLPSYRLADRLFTQWDGYRYEEILSGGYHYHLPSDPLSIQNASISTQPATGERRLKNVVWYPLYPLLGYTVKIFTRLPPQHALTLVSWLCILAAATLFVAYARDYIEQHPDAPRASPHLPTVAAFAGLTLLLLGPCSIFFYANFTEALFTLLLVAFLYCLQKKWFWYAAAVAAFASATRSQGVLFGPVLAVVYSLQISEKSFQPRLLAWARRLPTAFLLGCISALGILAYMLYLHATFGDALAFMHAQKNWNNGINAATLREALNPLNALGFFLWRLLHETPTDYPRLWETFCLLWPPVLLLGYRKKLSLDLTLLGWIFWALPYVSNSLAGNPPEDTKWMSMGRFTAVQIPLFLMLGWTLARGSFKLQGSSDKTDGQGCAPSCKACGCCGQLMSFLPFILIPASIVLFALFAYKFGAGEWIG